MRKCTILLLLFLCVAFLTGCGKKPEKETAKIPNKITSSYTYNNDPRFIIPNRVGNNILYGCIDKTGRKVIEPKYDSIYSAGEGTIVISEFKDNQLFYGLVDSQGKSILEPEYDGISTFSEGLAVVKSAGKSGYADKKGKFIIYPKYDYGYIFKEGIAKVVVENKVGFINKKGEYIIYPKYDYGNKDDIIGFKGGFTVVKNSGDYVLINKKGELIKKLDYDTIFDFSDDRYKVLKNQKYGLIDKSGNVLLEPKYKDLKSLDKDGKFIAFLKDNDKYGVMDKSLKEIIPEKYSNAIFYGDDIITLYDNENKKTLLYDTKGKLLAEADYKLLGGFSNDLCLIETHDAIYQGFINKKADLVLPLKYSIAASYTDGLAFVTEAKDDEVIVGYVDIKGNYVWKTNTLLTIEDLRSLKNYEIETQTQVATKTTPEPTTLKQPTKVPSPTKNKKTNNYYNDYNYNYNYNYDDRYYKPSKSKEVKEAEQDILN